MKTINIFVASSFELTDWRNVLGDAIRQWSDEYEPRGFRIKMLCWEDYHPEYTGTRKQTEYDEDLVKNSQIFIGLFRNRCGIYTREEINIAHIEKELSKRIHLFCDSNGKPDNNLKEFKRINDGRIVYQGNATELITSIKCILDEYISQYPKLLTQDVSKSNIIYATVGDDIIQEKYALGNVIRSIDYLAENELNARCRLFREDIAQIDKCDYFIGIVKDNVSDDKEQELCKAIMQTGSSSHPQVSVIYFNHNDGILNNNHNFRYLYYEKEPFNEPFDSFHRIKFNLLIWLLSNRVLQIDENSGLHIHKSWVMYMGEKIIPAELLMLKGKNDRERLKDLLKKIYDKLLFPHTPEFLNENIPMDLRKIDEMISDLNYAEDNGAYILNKTNQDRMELLKKIESRMSTISHNVSLISELISLNFRKEQVLRSLLKYNLINPDELLRTLTDILRLYSKYPSLFDDNFDEDSYFLETYTIADEYNIVRPEVEKFRMNYANHLSRSNNNNEALALYRQSLSRLNMLNDGTKLMTSYLISNYLNFIHSLLGLDLYDEGKRFILNYQDMISKYVKNHSTDIENTSYEITVLTAWLRIWRFDDKAENRLLEGIKVWNAIKESPIYANHNLWDDIYCYFPTVLASNITDSSYRYPQNKNLIEYAIQTLEESIHIIKKSKKIGSKLKAIHIAQHLHNLSNIVSLHLDNQELARKYALRSLRYRRELYNKYHEEHSLFEIADIQLMLGATYINGRNEYLTPYQSKIAMKYATHSYDVFKSLNNEGFLGPETKEYEAKFLIGTILLLTKNHEEEGINIIEECYSWHKSHPNNDYSETFESEYHRLNNFYNDREERHNNRTNITQIHNIASKGEM